ncbi:hypothetical protein ABT082_41770, partial [Streptomyces massasporeus]
MMLTAALLLLGAVTAVVAPRLLARADWPDREPVVALWVWQCVVAAVLVCCALSEGVLTTDPEPGLYVYEQQDGNGMLQRGII